MSTGTTNEQKTQIQAPEKWTENPRSFYNQLNEIQQQTILGIFEKLQKTEEGNAIQAETAEKLVLLNELLKNLKECKNFQMKDLNFSLSIKDIATLQNLSHKTEQQIINIIKQKVNSQKINEIQTTNLKDFLNQANLTFSENDKNFTEDEEAYKKLKNFQETRISNNEIFPEEFKKGLESTSEDLKKFLILQLSHKEQNEKELSYQIREQLTTPLERSFNNNYHLLKDCKYPLLEEEIAAKPEELQKKLKDLQKKISEEEDKDNPNIQQIRTRIQEYQYLQLPQNQEQIKKFLTESRKEKTRVQECRDNQNLLTQIAESTAEDLLHSTLFSQTFKTPEQQSDFKTFCKNLLNIEKSEIEIPTCEGKKTIKLQRHWNIKNKKIGISKEQIPFNFKISTKDNDLQNELKAIKSQKININDLSCEDLITLFQMLNTPKEEITKPELYGNYEDQQNNILANAPTPNNPNENPEAPETLRQKFDELRKEKANGIDFGRGAKIRIEAGSSDLPPDTDGKKYIKAEVISDNDNDFEVVVNGSELMMGDGWEGRTIKLNKTPETINRRKDFIVTKGDSSEENLAQLQKAKKAPNFTDIKREDNQYLRKGENEPVTYFSATDDANIGLPPDAKEKEAKIRKQPIVYEVAYTPDGVKIKSEYLDEKGNGHSFEKDMDYDQFFLFLSNKKIQPINKEKAKIAAEDTKQASLKYKQSMPREIQRFSRNAVTKGISGAWKKITDAIDAKDKKNEDDFNDWMLDPDGFDFYGKMSRRGIFSSVKDRAKEEATKQKIEGDKGVMNKINDYLKVMEEDDNYKDNILKANNYLTPFGNSPVLPALCGGKDPKQATMDDIVQLYNDPTSKKYRATAAVLLAQLKKRGTLYHGMPQLDGQGVWVKILLGEDARKKYLADREKLINQINQGSGDKKLLRNLLARSEVEFICNTINGDERDYFSGLKNYKGLPRAYAKELDSAYQTSYTTSGYAKEFEDTKHTCFSVAKEECSDKLKDGRFPAAVGQLKKMLTLVKTNKQHRESQAMFTALLLSGRINQYCGKKEKDFIIQMARAYSFPPGLVIEDMKFERIILDFFEEISLKCQNPAGSRHIIEEIKQAMDQEPRDIATIINKTQERFSKDNRQTFENFCKKDLILQERKDKPNMKTLRSELQKTDDLSTDQEVRENRDIAIHRGLNSNLGIITELKKYSKGDFEKMPDAKLLRENVISDIKSFDNTEEGMKHILSRFIDFFGMDQDQVEQTLLMDTITQEKLEEYFLGSILNGYENPPDLYQDVIITFAKKFMQNKHNLRAIIREKNPNQKKLTQKQFEDILKSNEKNHRKIKWKYKLGGIGYRINNKEEQQQSNNTEEEDDDDNTNPPSP